MENKVTEMLITKDSTFTHYLKINNITWEINQYDNNITFLSKETMNNIDIIKLLKNYINYLLDRTDRQEFYHFVNLMHQSINLVSEMVDKKYVVKEFYKGKEIPYEERYQMTLEKAKKSVKDLMAFNGAMGYTYEIVEVNT